MNNYRDSEQKYSYFSQAPKYYLSIVCMIGALEEKVTSTMSDFVIDAIDNVLKHPRNLVKIFCRDRAEVNELEMEIVN